MAIRPLYVLVGGRQRDCAMDVLSHIHFIYIHVTCIVSRMNGEYLMASLFKLSSNCFRKMFRSLCLHHFCTLLFIGYNLYSQSGCVVSGPTLVGWAPWDGFVRAFKNANEAFVAFTRRIAYIQQKTRWMCTYNVNFVAQCRFSEVNSALQIRHFIGSPPPALHHV